MYWTGRRGRPPKKTASNSVEAEEEKPEVEEEPKKEDERTVEVKKDEPKEKEAPAPAEPAAKEKEEPAKTEPVSKENHTTDNGTKPETAEAPK